MVNWINGFDAGNKKEKYSLTFRLGTFTVLEIRVDSEELRFMLLEETSSKPGYFRLKSHGVGKYGRVLGELFIQDTDGNSICVNDLLITEGHAYVYDGGKKKIFLG